MAVEDNEEELLGTRDDSQGGTGSADPTAEEQYFLDVDDRHRYKTKEEAIKAIRESGERIGVLTPWEKEVGEAFQGLTPARTAELLDELIELRAKVKSGQPTVTPERAAEAAKDPKVAAQEKANLEWLKSQGFISKAEMDATLKELRDTVAALQGGAKTAEQERVNQRIQQGEEVIRGFITEAKLSEKLGETAFKYIRGCLSEANDPDGKLFKEFMQGGTQMRTILKSLFDEFASGLTLARMNSDGNYQRDKEKSAQRAGTQPPKGGQGAGEKDGKEAQQKKVFHGSTDPKVHDAAWERFQAALK